MLSLIAHQFRAMTLTLPILYLLSACSGGDSSDSSNTPASTNTSIAASCVVEPPVRLTIETAGRAPITSRADYLNATLTLNGQTLSTRIRGRGNSTWEMPKKPYRINLDEATGLLGMPAARNWALLANYIDKTMLRNALAFCTSETLGLEYTPRSKFVELTLNGQYEGVYQLTEHIETGSNRVNIGPETETSNGFFLEMDGMYLQEEAWFISSMGLPYVFKSDDHTPEQMVAIETYMNEMERRLNTDYVALSETVDIESFVAYYLVNEWLKNNDAFFFSSTFVYRRQNERLRFGPVWDFDIAAGNINRNGNDDPTGFWTRDQAYPQRAFQSSEFEARVKERWSVLRSQVPAILEAISASARALDESQRRNFERWDILDVIVPPNPVATGSYQGEIDYLQNWLRMRTDWLESQFGTP
jgi:hypothetical protein